MQDAFSWTALHVAVTNQCLEAALYLVNQARVAINPVDCFEHTPLDDAVRLDSVLLPLLIRKGALPGDDPLLVDRVHAMRARHAAIRGRQDADQVW
jgi:ankyrin repeat protein